MRSQAAVWRRLCQSLDDVHAGQVTTLAAAGGRTAAEARGRLQLMLRCGGRSLLTSAQRAVTEGVPASRIIEKATKPAADARPLWRRLLSSPPPQQATTPGGGGGGIVARIFGRRTAEAQWRSDPASLGTLAGVVPSSGSAGVPYFGYLRHIVRPVLFSGAVTCAAFAWALCRDEDRRASGRMPVGQEELRRQLRASHGSPLGSSAQVTERRLTAHQQRAEQAPREHLTAMQWANSLPMFLRPGAMAWAAIPDPARTLAAIVGVNVAVFGLWRVPVVRRLMARSFCHTPGAGRSYTLLTSAFSHRGLLHLGANMVVLWSFGSSIFQELGREQFLAVYTSAAVLASLASHLWTTYPLVGKGLPADALLARVRAIRPSLGASGAVVAVFAIVAARQPDRQVALIFAPQYPFSIGTGFLGMVSFDILGTIFRLQIFDHQAHLGGAAFGGWYAAWGGPAVWDSPLLRRKALEARESWRRLGEDAASPPAGDNPPAAH